MVLFIKLAVILSLACQGNLDYTDEKDDRPVTDSSDAAADNNSAGGTSGGDAIADRLDNPTNGSPSGSIISADESEDNSAAVPGTDNDASVDTSDQTTPVGNGSDSNGLEDDGLDGNGSNQDTDNEAGPPEGFLLIDGTVDGDVLGEYPSQVLYLSPLEKGCSITYDNTPRMSHRFFTVPVGAFPDATNLADHKYGLLWHYGQHDHDGNTSVSPSLFKTRNFFIYDRNATSRVDWDVSNGSAITWVFDHDGYLKGYSNGYLRAKSKTAVDPSKSLYLSFATPNTDVELQFPSTVTTSCLDFRLISPNGSETYLVAESTTISWESYGMATNVRLSYSTDNFIEDINVIVSSTENDGSYSWTIPQALSTTVKVRVESLDQPSQYDTSDFRFTIQSPPDEDMDGLPDAVDTDDDNDGVNDSDEAIIGTDPKDPDSDGNGISDGAEDADNDGISNADESDENSSTPTDNDGDGNYDIESIAGDDSQSNDDQDSNNEQENSSALFTAGTDGSAAKNPVGTRRCGSESSGSGNRAPKCGSQGYCMNELTGQTCNWDCQPGWCSCTAGTCFDQNGKCTVPATYPAWNNYKATCSYVN